MLDRKIFSYNDGFEDVHADPGEIDYRFAKASESEDMDTLNKWLEVPDEDATTSPDTAMEKAMEKARESRLQQFAEACHRLDPIVRHAFEIRPFDRKTGQGMLHEEVINLYLAYMEWKFDLKKNTD